MSTTRATPLMVPTKAHTPPQMVVPRARPPRASLSMRTLSKRVVAWACVCDTDPEPMTGTVTLTTTSGEDAPQSAFIECVDEVLATLDGWFCDLAARHGCDYVELALSNPGLRAAMLTRTDLRHVAVLPASFVTGRDEIVTASVALADEMHLRLIAPSADATVDVAVAVSLRARRRGAGLAWVRPDGLYETRFADVSDRSAASVLALAMALRAHRWHPGRLNLATADRLAARLARDAMASRDLSVVPARAASQRHLRQFEPAGQVRVVVSGHDDVLASAAARLALLSRRDHEVGIEGAQHQERATAAVRDELGTPLKRSA